MGGRKKKYVTPRLNTHVYFSLRQKEINYEKEREQIRSFFGHDIDPFVIDPKAQYRDGVHYLWNPLNLLDTTGYTLYISIVNRIQYLNDLLTQSMKSSPYLFARLSKIIYRLIDECIPLTIYMQITEQFADKYYFVDEPAIYKVLKPRPELAFDANSIPDCTIHAMYCNIWGIETEDIYLPSDVDNIIIDILSKSLPTACKSREMSRILLKRYKQAREADDLNVQKTDTFNLLHLIPQAPLIKELLIRIIMASMLGTYESSEISANFNRRQQLYHWFMWANIEMEELCKWISDYKSIIQYVIREFIFDTISRIPALNDYLENTYQWFKMKRNATNCMDEIRKLLNEDYSYQEEDHVLFTCEQYAKNMNINMLKIAPRFRKLTSTQMIVNHMKHNDAIEVDNETKDHMHQIFDLYYNEQTRLKENFSYAWLIVTFNINPGSYTSLRNAEALYKQETDRTAIKYALINIQTERPYDYAVLKLYFMELAQRQAVRVYYLPKDILHQQINAYSHIYGTNDLPASAGLYYFCPSCASIKAYVATHKSVLNYASLCHQRIFHDTFQGKMYCKKPRLVQFFDINTEKIEYDEEDDIFYKVPLEDPNQNKTKKKRKKAIQARKETSEICTETELIPINMLGKVLHTATDGNVIICPSCGILTKICKKGYDNSTGIFSCGCVKKNKCTRSCFFCECKHNHYVSGSMRTIYIYDGAQLDYIFICQKCLKNNYMGLEREYKIYILDTLTKIKHGEGRFHIIQNQQVYISHEEFERMEIQRLKRYKMRL